MSKWFPPEEFYTAERCTRCGVCCGATDGHPCEHLCRDENGLYSCEIYEERFGVHQTTDGHHFACAAIREVIENNGGYGCCAYVAEIRRIRESMGQETSDLGRLGHP